MTTATHAPLPPHGDLPDSAPSFMCPQCQCTLEYVGSELKADARTGADVADFYVCPAGCGSYQRDRSTHRFRSLAGDGALRIGGRFPEPEYRR